MKLMGSCEFEYKLGFVYNEPLGLFFDTCVDTFFSV